MVKKMNFYDKKKFILAFFLILFIFILPNVRANICDNSFEHYKDYIKDTLIRSPEKIENDLMELGNVITYDGKKLIKDISYRYNSMSDLEVNITSGIGFSDISLLDFMENPIDFIIRHLEKVKVDEEPFNISSESFDAYYSIFRDTIFFDIIKGLNVTHINFNGTEYKIDSNKENIINIIKSSKIKDYIDSYPENFTLDFKIKIDNGTVNCTKDVKLDFKFFGESIQVDAMIGLHSILMNAEFEEDSVKVSFEYEDIILVVNIKLDGEKITELNENNSAIVDSPNDEVIITIPEDVTEASTIDISSLISSGQGDIPKITVKASNANNIIVNIPATKITSSSTSWDGIIQVPTIVSVSIPITQGVSRTQSIAIKVGSNSGTLTFDKAVKLIFPGEAGKKVAFFTDGEFNEIDTACLSNSQSWADSNLDSGKDCYINDGSDLVVWTKHFTEFVTYTEKEVSPQSLSKKGLCTTSWTCSAWSACINGIQTRTCSYPNNFCTPNSPKPEETRFCSTQKEEIVLNEPEDKQIKAGLGPGAIIGGSASLYWILFVLVIIIITLIVVLVKSIKKEKKELEGKDKEGEDIEEDEKTGELKEEDKKPIKKPRKAKKNKEKQEESVSL